MKTHLVRLWLASLLGAVALPALAASHSWKVQELFSNAEGTVQFVELYCPLGASNEIGMSGKKVTSVANGDIHTFTSNLPSNSTSNKHLLLATQAFADLAGAPTPDHIIAANSFSLEGDTIQWHVYSQSIMTAAAGAIPTDGINSLTRDGATGPNTPTNFAGATGTVDAGGPGMGPAAVPDGSGTGTPMTVDALDPSGSNLRILWDQSTCSVGTNHQLLYGQRSDLPGAPGLAFSPGGSVCGIVSPSPFDWIGAPNATDGSGLIWWLVVVEDSGVEGSWGRTGSGLERDGPGPAGSSAQCGVTTKDLSNACGQ